MMLSIAETFHSVQGEGVWAGVPMLFIRTAGCNVGRYTKSGLTGLNYSDSDLLKDGKHSECETVDGQKFCCDTDYHKFADMYVEELLSDLWEQHVCITGGEPMLHQEKLGMTFLLSECRRRRVRVHFETSGTVLISPRTASQAWITCSPKKGFRTVNTPFVHEWKFVIGPDYEEKRIVETIGTSKAPVYVQPVNYIGATHRGNLRVCMELQRRHPEWRISTQMHKLFGLR